MTSRTYYAAAVAALVLSACGGGDGGVQGEVADMIIGELGEEDLELDEGCVRDATSELSDDDAQAILDAGPEGDPADISADAGSVAIEVIGCIDTGAFVDDMIDSMIADMGEENVDVDCVREATEDLDLATLDEDDPAALGAIFDCITIDFGG